MATYGERRRKGTNRGGRRRVRYDRIAAVAAVFIVLIIILVSCTSRCGSDDKDSSSTSSIRPTDAKKDDSSKKSEESSAASLEGYSTVTLGPDAVLEGDLVLVNSQHAYGFPASDEENIKHVYELKTDSYQVADYETDLKSECITALNSMMDAFYSETGLADLMIVSGFRTKEYQDGINADGTTEVKGGYSDYHTGLCFDLAIYPEGGNSQYYSADGDYSWIAENCAKYGFVLRYPEGKDDVTGMTSNSYTFRYVGVPHALCMNENQLCLEDYIDYVKNYPYDGEHLKVSGADKNYEVYYVAANSSGDTEVSVPSDKTYTVSGNNIDGFIVTVELTK